MKFQNKNLGALGSDVTDLCEQTNNKQQSNNGTKNILSLF